MTAYYNEIDPFAAQWLRNLIAAGHLPVGDVDERSIIDVQPGDLTGYAQCHFFAGVGGWPYALRLAGWPDDEPVWTGSCPCQPFSAAGKGAGTADERHLWPSWLRLIEECRPRVIFGEQVASAAVLGHQGKGQRVSTQVSGAQPGERPYPPRTLQGDEAGPCVRLGSVGSGDSEPHQCGGVRGDGHPLLFDGGPHMGQPVTRPGQPIRGVPVLQHSGRSSCGEQCFGGLGGTAHVGDGPCHLGEAARRLQPAFDCARGEAETTAGEYWFTRVCADLEGTGYRVGACDLPAAGVGAPHIRQRLYWVADTDGAGQRAGGEPVRESEERDDTWRGGTAGGVADARQLPTRRPTGTGEAEGGRAQRDVAGRGDTGGVGDADNTGSQGRCERGNGPGQRSAWAASVGLLCGDGKTRRVPLEPALFPLATGLPNRVGILRGAGNAIVPPLAAEFVRAYMEVSQ